MKRRTSSVAFLANIIANCLIYNYDSFSLVQYGPKMLQSVNDLNISLYLLEFWIPQFSYNDDTTNWQLGNRTVLSEINIILTQ